MNDLIDKVESAIRLLYGKCTAHQSVSKNNEDPIRDKGNCLTCIAETAVKTIKALDGEMTTRERLNRLTYDAARDGFYDEVVSVEDILKTLDNKRNCEHEWITYGTRGQECKKCGFMHDYS
jgi:hypothetical protein